MKWLAGRARSPVLSLRARLALWMGFIGGLLLIVFGVLVLAWFRSRGLAAIDSDLAADLSQARRFVHHDDAGRLQSATWLGEDYNYGIQRWFQVTDPAGTVLLSVPEAPPVCARMRQREGTIELDERFYRIAAFRCTNQLTDDTRTLLAIMAISFYVGVALAAFSAWLVSKRLLRPLIELQVSARSLSISSMDSRLRVGHQGPEIDALAVTFNETFSRLQASFAELERFTADAAHEMRTSLTALRSIGEVSVQQSPEIMREAVVSMLDETRRLSLLVDQLLMLAMSDRGLGIGTLVPMDLTTQVEEVRSLFEAVAEEHGQHLVVEGLHGGPFTVTIDGSLLRRAVLNLVGNAITHCPQGTTIRVRFSREPGAVCLDIADDGPGIAPEHLPHLCKRFYRVDPARSRRAEGGFGLGLAIAEAAVHANRGTLTISSTLGQGTCFRIRLPVAESS
jgi:signal transduction histidine kinase